MKYDVCIIGHGNFPDGVKTAMNLLVGPDDSIKLGNLNEVMTHEAFKKEMEEYLDSHENVIIFADMTGGAPYQITAELILEKEKKNQFVVSSMSLNAILDLYLKNMMDQLNPDNIDEEIAHVIEESCKLMQVTPNNIVDAADNQDDEIEDGI